MNGQWEEVDEQRHPPHSPARRSSRSSGRSRSSSSSSGGPKYGGFDPDAMTGEEWEKYAQELNEEEKQRRICSRSRSRSSD